MGDEVGMQSTILALLRLFRARDPETNTWVTELVADRNQWPRAHDLFDLIRDRLLVATGDAGRPHVSPDRVDRARVGQYAFEELCLKTLYNETHPRDPFDPSSPFFVAGSAIWLARTIGVPESEVLAIVAAHASPEKAYYRQVFPSYPRPTAAATRVPGRSASAEEVAREFPDLQQFPTSHPGPYERNMGDQIAGLLGLFQGCMPDATSNASGLRLAVTADRWSAGHALFDILDNRLDVAMRARDQIRYLQYELERSCLQALYNATSPVHPFAPGSPFWVAGAAFRLASAIGAPEQAVVAVLAPTAEQGAPADGGRGSGSS
jgi:hypothetical protein